MSDLKNLRVQAQRLKDDGARYVPIDPASVLGLLDQLEAAQKDAARYQWLRDNCIKRGIVIDVGAGAEIPDTLDEAIDDAMASKS